MIAPSPNYVMFRNVLSQYTTCILPIPLSRAYTGCFFFNALSDSLPAFHRTPRVGEFQQSMTGASQTIAVMITFIMSKKISLERRVGAYRSGRKKHRMLMQPTVFLQAASSFIVSYLLFKNFASRFLFYEQLRNVCLTSSSSKRNVIFICLFSF